MKGGRVTVLLGDNISTSLCVPAAGWWHNWDTGPLLPRRQLICENHPNEALLVGNKEPGILLFTGLLSASILTFTVPALDT